MTAQESTISRWLFTWITILGLVVVVVIGFLIGIVNALDSIDGHLGTASSAVTNIHGDAIPLAGHIQDINGNLSKIDTALKPIPGVATSIIGGLTSIKGSLTSVDSSLKSTLGSLGPTSAALVDTSNSLVDTSSKLVDVSNSLVSTAGTGSAIATSLVSTSGNLVTTNHDLTTILSLLRQVQSVPNGTAAVNPKVVSINSSLTDTEHNASQINGGLIAANNHLNSICTAPLLTASVSALAAILGTVTSLVGLLQTSTPCPAN
jgi:hypothetical protein